MTKAIVSFIYTNYCILVYLGQQFNKWLFRCEEKRCLYFPQLVFFPSPKVEQLTQRPVRMHRTLQGPLTACSCEVDSFLAAMKSHKLLLIQNPFGKGKGRGKILEWLSIYSNETVSICNRMIKPEENELSVIIMGKFEHHLSPQSGSPTQLKHDCH